jgi:type I restriction enzyme S subunit
MPKISGAKLLGVQVPVPPLHEQRRIAALLDKADAIRRRRQQAIRLADDLLRSVFLDMFGDPVTNHRRWPGSLLGHVSDIQGGLQVTAARQGRPLEVPYLRVANVYRDRLDLSEVKTLRVTDQELTRAALKSGDLLVVEGHGNPEEIGRCAVWRGAVARCVHQNHLIRVRVHSGIEPVFVSAYLNSAAGRRQMTRFGKTTSGLNTISTANVAAVRVLVPPVEVQRRYVAFAGLLATLVGRLEASQRLAEENLKALAQGVFGTERQPT